MDRETSPVVTGIRWWVWAICLGSIALAINPGATLFVLFLLGPSVLWTAGLIGVVVLVWRKVASR